RLLLMRLAALFGPEAIAHAPRAARFQTEGDVRVVVGLQALTRAIAEIDRLPESARTPGVVASDEEVTQMVNPTINPESVARRIRGMEWKMIDRSDTGCMVELDTGHARYLIRFTQPLERQAGWTWALFSAVRKLSP